MAGPSDGVSRGRVSGPALKEAAGPAGGDASTPALLSSLQRSDSWSPPTKLVFAGSAAGQGRGGSETGVPIRVRMAADGGGHLRAAERSQGWQRDPAGMVRGGLVLKRVRQRRWRG